MTHLGALDGSLVCHMLIIECNIGYNVNYNIVI
jgi:hypothetical protein